jgi:dihydrofolate reductase
MNHINAIVAHDDKNGIANGTTIPWNLPTDKAYFRDKIQVGPVLLGRATYEANKAKPFGSGTNYLLTHQPVTQPGIKIVSDIKQFLDAYKCELWVIGGGQVYAQTLPYVTRLYVTRVVGDFGCTIFFPDYSSSFRCVEKRPNITENGITFSFETWERVTSAR